VQQYCEQSAVCSEGAAVESGERGGGGSTVEIEAATRERVAGELARIDLHPLPSSRPARSPSSIERIPKIT
jgi:hypothetical protein